MTTLRDLDVLHTALLMGCVSWLPPGTRFVCGSALYFVSDSNDGKTVHCGNDHVYVWAGVGRWTEWVAADRIKKICTLPKDYTVVALLERSS